MASGVTHAGSAELAMSESRTQLRKRRVPPKSLSSGASFSARRRLGEAADSAGPPSSETTAATRAG